MERAAGLGARLRAAREWAGLTQEEAASALGVTHALISYWENDRRTPGLGHLTRLAEIYGTTVTNLLDPAHEEPAGPQPALLFRDLRDLAPQTQVRLRQWIAFLDDWADLLDECGDVLPGPGQPPVKAWQRARPITDVQRAPSLAVDARKYYGLGLDAIPDLQTFLDQQGILVYRVALDPLDVPGSAFPPLGAASAGAGPSAPASQIDRRLAFLNGAAERRTVSAEALQDPISPYTVQAGAVIAAAMVTGLRSDLPGQITAQVTENVYDSPTGRILLIPQGSRLIGQYDAEVAFGQSRALLVWNRLILPNGRSIVLERQPGADASGYAGLEDEVDNHWGQLFRGAVLSTLLSIGAEAGASSDESDLLQAIRRGGSDSISQTGRQIVGRSLDIQPTITIRPGFPVRVIVTRDLVLEPYGAM